MDYYFGEQMDAPLNRKQRRAMERGRRRLSRTREEDGLRQEQYDEADGDKELEEFIRPYLPAPKHYPKEKLEEIADGYMDDSLEGMRQIEGQNDPSVAYRERVASRVKDAAVRTAPRMADMYGKRYPGVASIEDEFIWLETMLSKSYDSLGDGASFVLAAAIWILDDLKSSGKLKEAYRYLPKTYEELDCVHCNGSPRDPCFDSELIRSVACVLMRRNMDPGKARDSSEPVIADRWCAKGDGRPRTQWRADFEGLMGLVSVGNAQAACRYFEEKQAEYFGMILECTERFHKMIAPMASKIWKISRRLRSYQRAARNDQSEATENIGKKEEDHKEFRRMLDEVNDINGQKRQSVIELNNGLSSPIAEVAERAGEDVAGLVRSFQIEDPYSICFALIYLLEKGSDSPWLFSSGMAVMIRTAISLPWINMWYGDPKETNMGKPVSYGEDKRTAGRESEKKNEYLPRLYEVRFDDGISSLAHLIYRTSASLLPRHNAPYEKLTAKLNEEGVDKTDIEKCILLADILAETSGRDYALNLYGYDQEDGAQEGAAEEQADQEEQLKELASLKEERKRLLRTLHEKERELQDARARLEYELEESGRERRELADLREIIFTVGVSEDEAERLWKKEGHNGKVEFPYVAKARLTIVGGHDRFLSKIRKMLTGVRYISADQPINPDIIKNSDAVWVQTNHMSHPQYYSLVDVARKCGTPLRYFLFSGAEKCVMQIADADACT